MLEEPAPPPDGVSSSEADVGCWKRSSPSLATIMAHMQRGPALLALPGRGSACATGIWADIAKDDDASTKAAQ